MTEIIADFKRYISERNTMLVMVFVLNAALFIFWAQYDIVTLDAEGFYSLENGEKWYTQWIEIGRWAFFALKHLLDVVAINPFFSNALFFTLFPLSAVLWDFLFVRWRSAETPAWTLLVFSAIYLSHPIWALQFGYRNQMDVMSIALFVAPLGLLLLGEWMERRRPLAGIAALSITTFEFGCYQSFIFVFATGIYLYFFLTYQDKRSSQRGGSDKGPWIKLLYALAFLVVAFALNFGISKAVQAATGVVPETAYLSAQFRWSEDGIRISALRIIGYIGQRMFGDGVTYTALFAVEVAVLLVWLVARTVKGAPHAAFIILMAIVIVLRPFTLEIVTAGEIVDRSQLNYVITVAFLGAFELIMLMELDAKGAKKAALGALAVVLALVAVVPQIQMETRLLYSNAHTTSEDRDKMMEIYYQAMQLGAHPGDAICLIGGQHNSASDTILEYEVVGYSYFEHTLVYNGAKTIEAMQAYGLDVTAPDSKQMETAESEADDLDVWPTGDSIKVHDGFFTVRLS